MLVLVLVADSVSASDGVCGGSCTGAGAVRYRVFQRNVADCRLLCCIALGARWTVVVDVAALEYRLMTSFSGRCRVVVAD